MQIKDQYNELIQAVADAVDDSKFHLPPKRQLKGLYRIVEKAAMRPGEMRHMVNNILDVCRGMILFANDKAIGK